MRKRILFCSLWLIGLGGIVISELVHTPRTDPAGYFIAPTGLYIAGQVFILVVSSAALVWTFILLIKKMASTIKEDFPPR